MPRYWFTTHWPSCINEPPKSESVGIWVKDGLYETAKLAAPGDWLIVYVTKNSKTKIRRLHDGTTEAIPRRKGRSGVEVIAQLTSPLIECLEERREEYTDGTEAWWRYHATAEVRSSSGFLGRERAAVLLGYQPGHKFMGYGTREIDAEKGEAIIAAYLESSVIRQRKSSKKRGPSGISPVGEGPVHKAIKERIAADPAGVLGEAGLRLDALEHEFATRDRVDILLRDRFERPVVVEVEPHCGPDEVVGPAQCMKYRALAAYEFDVPRSEVRTILAAPTIDESLHDGLRRHGIDWVLVEPE